MPPAARLLPALLLAACGSNAPAQREAAPAADAPPFKVTRVADLTSPWALAFLPDGRMLVTEKDGRMLLVSQTGDVVGITGVPAVDSAGQGALMDVVPSPRFAQDRTVYFSFSEAGPGGKGVALARATLAITQPVCVRAPCPPRAALNDAKVIFRTPKVTGNGHYSGRIAFAPDGRHLFFTAGERQKFTPAQDPKSPLGKVLRLDLDGAPAAGNPLAARGFHPAVWSYGHRNLLGIAFDARGNLWEQEMGPKGGDEVNLILPGRNYGWPAASNGSHYDGRDIPDHRPGDGFEPPKVWWNPVISPGGMMIYSGAMFPQWRGDAFIGGLSSESLVRVHLDGTAAAKGDQWPMGARIRDVAEGPDGAIWIVQDGQDGSPGDLLKLTAR